MYGNNPIFKQDLTREELKVVKIFPTIQGEGPYVGMPVVFVRLHGCNLRCHFCDTKFDDPNDPWITVGEIKREVHHLAGEHIKRVILTGGEPFAQDITDLCIVLNSGGIAVQIETAGTLWIPGFELVGAMTEIIVSPKTPKIHPEIAKRAKWWKYVIRAGEQSPIDGLPIFSTQVKGQRIKLARPPDGEAIDDCVIFVPRECVYLSPCDEGVEAANAINRKLVADLAIKHGYRAGIQIHKFMGIE